MREQFNKTTLLSEGGPVRYEMNPRSTVIAIVGEAPGPRSDWRVPLVGGHSGNRLRRMMGLTMLSYLRLFRTYNLFDEYPGSKWSAPKARKSAEMIVVDFRDMRSAILLGRKVADAFEVEGEFFTKAEVGGTTFLLLPHPSGRNRVWNDVGRMQDTMDAVRVLIAAAKT